MRERGVVGVAVLWLIVAVGALGYSALKIGRWQKSRSSSEMAEIQSRLLIAGSAMLAREAKFKFVEKTDRFESGTVRVVKVPTENPAIVGLVCNAKVGSFEKNVNVAWYKTPNDWQLAYWAEP